MPASGYVFLFPLVSCKNVTRTFKAEFSYKLKPKLPAQFKAAESASVPLAVILGEEEQSAGKVRVKEMGLPEGHPEKEGALVEITDLPVEVKKRLAYRAETPGRLADLVGKSARLGVQDGKTAQNGG